MYAVIDLETTGLNPARHDRIVEIAIVHVDDAGDITSEWCTLVNPQRDLGPQRIHGIRAADARRAPTFTQMAPQIAELLRGRVLVAHNIAFDGPFLDHQFAQLGLTTPIRTAENLCTMMLAGTYLPASGRSLAACCAAADIPLEHAHCALDDARAAALLLGFYLRSSDIDPDAAPPWLRLTSQARTAVWPALTAEPLPEVRRAEPDAIETHFLSRLVDRLPRVSKPPQADAYLDLLDRALVDRRISATESDALVTVATSVGLSRHDVVDLHNGYLADLAAAALRDGAFTEAERADLAQVATLLGLPTEAVDRALAQAANDAHIPRQRTVGQWRLYPGDIVAFTGETTPPREVLEQRARDAGLTVSPAVTRDTHLLVAADVDTMSQKARKAHTYGIPVIDSATFLTMVAADLRMTP